MSEQDHISVNIDVSSIPNSTVDLSNQKKEIRNRFIIQILTTLTIIAFCIYSILSEGKLPDKDSLIYALLGGISGLWIPSPKVFH